MIDVVFRVPARHEPAELVEARARSREVIAKADRVLRIVEEYRQQDGALRRHRREL